MSPTISVPKQDLTWIVAVITAPRPVPTLAATLDSLAAAGFRASLISRDTNRVGCWQNWLTAARVCADAALQSPADRILIIEDDCQLTASLAAHFDHAPPPTDGVCSLYCSAELHNPEGLFRWRAVPVPLMAHGSLAYVMTPEIARRIAYDPPFPNRPHGTDHAVGTFCRRENIPYYVHSPSLAKHLAIGGCESALGGDAGGRMENRQCIMFANYIVEAKDSPDGGFISNCSVVAQPCHELLVEVPRGTSIESC